MHGVQGDVRLRMRNIVTPLACLALFGAAVLAACSKSDEGPPPAQPGQYTGDPPQLAPEYAAAEQPQSDPRPTAATASYTAPLPAPATVTPAEPGSGASEPSAVAFPCQTDVQCLSHRCNLQVGRCAWPCQSNDDCQAGFQCVTPSCVPAQPK
jgi:hypothetical protein